MSARAAHLTQACGAHDTSCNRTGFARTLWNATAFGSKCAAPYECGDGFASDSKQLLACSMRSAPRNFFGAPRLGPELGPMEGQFFEFLQTVGEASILKRVDERGIASSRRARTPSSGRAGAPEAARQDGAAGSGDAADDGGVDQSQGFGQSLQDGILVDPSTYLDFQTREVEVTMAAFSADLGIASLIRIVAKVSSQVSVDYFVEHYQSTEGERLLAYQAVAGCAMALSVVILIEKAWVMYCKLRSVQGVTVDDKHDFVFEVVLQCCLPITFFSMRLTQLQRSGYLVDHTVGQSGLAGQSSSLLPPPLRRCPLQAAPVPRLPPASLPRPDLFGGSAPAAAPVSNTSAPSSRLLSLPLGCLLLPPPPQKNLENQ